MLKIISISILFPLLFLIFQSASTKTDSNTSPTPSPTQNPAYDKLNGVENIILDEERVHTWCPSSMSEDAMCSKNDLNVKVKSLSKDAEQNGLKYYYTVSGGEIIGEGADVVWNFADIRPGKYTITASVGNDSLIYGNTVTKTVEVEECPVCDAPCACPTIKISGPVKPIKAGNSFIIKAEINGGSQTSVIYKWKITGGKIVSDANAPQIIVKADSDRKNFNITASVELDGLCAICPNYEESKTFVVK